MSANKAAPEASQPDPHRLSKAYALEPKQVAETLGVDPATGLSATEVAERSAIAGPNELRPARRESILEMLIGSATEPFVILLAVAGGLAIGLGEVRDGLLVLGGLVPIVGADVITEFRAERALEALRDATAPVARVRRGGTVSEVPASTLVPGDVVLLQTGDILPADLRLIRADRLLFDRSLLTGESLPEEGRVHADPVDATLADRRSIAYAGSGVVGGRGEGIVIATAGATEVGRIAERLATHERRRSPLQAELDRLVRILLVVALGLIVVVTSLGFARGQGLGANVLAGISAAIAAIPEEPPVLLAVILGLGAYRLLRRGVLVRRLTAEESLGAIDLILTDKTGTLTENRLDVAAIRTVDGTVTDELAELSILDDAIRAEEDAWTVSQGAVAGSFTRALGRAITARGGSMTLDPAALVETFPVTDRLAISRTRSRRPDGSIAELAVGAPEVVLGLNGEDGPDDRDGLRWVSLVEAAATEGGRLVALAERRADVRDGDDRWRVRAIIEFADPIRVGIREALAEAAAAGIGVIVVTGDHPRTAAAIARGAGLGDERVVTGSELASWDDERLVRELPTLHIVARSTPEQKERLVRVARAAGRMVAVTGDGVNDAPALHRADVAVAMGSGTAVAREASDLVLGDDSFATLMFALGQGRRIVDNVRKGLVFLVSTHVAMLGFLLIATVAGFGQPLLPIQILWLELFIDTSTSIAFEREPAEPDLMRRSPRPVGVPLLPRRLLAQICIAGGFSAVAALVLIETQGGFEHARWLAYTALVCGQAVRGYANRSLTIPIHRLPPNRVLGVACLAVIVVQALIPAIPPLAEAFRATMLDANDWVLVAIVALGPALLGELIRSVRPTTWVA